MSNSKQKARIETDGKDLRHVKAAAAVRRTMLAKHFSTAHITFCNDNKSNRPPEEEEVISINNAMNSANY